MEANKAYIYLTLNGKDFAGAIELDTDEVKALGAFELLFLNARRQIKEAYAKSNEGGN